MLSVPHPHEPKNDGNVNGAQKSAKEKEPKSVGYGKCGALLGAGACLLLFGVSVTLTYTDRVTGLSELIIPLAGLRIRLAALPGMKIPLAATLKCPIFKFFHWQD